MSTPMDMAKLILPGAMQAAAGVLDFVIGLARTAGLSEQQARAELEHQYQQLQKRADRVEAAPVFDPDAPKDPDPTAPGR